MHQDSRRVIAGSEETWVGGAAWSDVTEEYEGPCRVKFSSRTGRVNVAVFPKYCEAHAAAMFGVTVDLGGYCEVEVTAAADGETVTHLTSASWLEE